MPDDSLADSAIIKVRGYVTDAKRVGYQVLTNYENIYWRALVGNAAWSLYEVLRSFCHNGNNTCNPSVQFLTTILGLEDKRALIGRSKTVKGKEYRYPGLIEMLQEHKLAVAEVQGKPPKTWYLFHVNLTPDLLTPEQVAQLPTLLRKKHAELLKRCTQEQHELEAKRKPSRFINSNKNRDDPDTEGGGNFPRGVGISHGGGGNFPPKQQPITIPNKTTGPRESINNNSSGRKDDKQDVVVALVNEKLSEKTAVRLAQRYDRERILQKIAYLAFLCEQDPEWVKKPQGWLRRAIEEDYGPPDGFLTTADRARRDAERAEQAQRAEAAEQQQHAFTAQLQSQQEAFRRQLRERYGATAADEQLWQEVCIDCQHSQPHLHQLCTRAYVLACAEETVLLGFDTETWLHQLEHPGTLAALKRALKRVAGRPLEVATLLLTAETMGDPGERSR